MEDWLQLDSSWNEDDEIFHKIRGNASNGSYVP